MTGRWTLQEAALSPIPRSCAMATVLNNSLYVIGGWLRYLNAFSDVWRFDIALQEWTPVPITNIAPSASGTLATANGKIYMYGGIFQFSNGSNYLIGDVTEIDPVTNRAVLLTPSSAGSVPPPRQLHSAVVYNNTM